VVAADREDQKVVIDVSIPPPGEKNIWIIEPKGNEEYGSVLRVAQESLLRSKIASHSLLQANRKGEEPVQPSAWTLRDNVVHEDVCVIVTLTAECH